MLAVRPALGAARLQSSSLPGDSRLRSFKPVQVVLGCTCRRGSAGALAQEGSVVAEALPRRPADLLCLQGAGPEEPGSAARPSAAVTLPPSGSMRPSAPGSARPSARMFDTEQEFANDDLLDGQQWQADEAADDAPRQSADGQPNGLPEQPTGSRCGVSGCSQMQAALSQRQAA